MFPIPNSRRQRLRGTTRPSRRLRCEPLEHRLLLSAASEDGQGQTHSWHNRSLAADVNADGLVTAVDALKVISEFTRRDYTDDSGRFLSFSAPPSDFLDVDANDYLTARDALLVIHHLNVRAQTLHIAAAGDSNTQNYAQTYGRLSQVLGNFEGQFAVSAAGLPGHTASRFLSVGGVDQVLSSDPDVIVLMLGTNDAARAHLDEGWLLAYTSAMESIMDQLLAGTNSHGAAPELILLTPLPIIPPFPQVDTADAAINQITAWLHEQAHQRGLRIVDVNALIRQQPGWRDWYDDGVHLWSQSAAGYWWLAELVAGEITGR